MTEQSSPPDWDALLTQTSWIRGLASSLVADPSTADDIVQQTWLTAAEKPPKHGRNLRSWFGSVVRSRASKHWRSEQAVLRKHDALKVEEVEADEAIVERMETVRLLAEGVASLKEPYATAVYLRFYEELTMREIAERQRIPLNTAQTHVSRGLILLRQKLASKVGQQWRNRCLVFATPLPAASSLLTGTAIAIAMTLKTKLLLAAALLLLTSLVVVQPWDGSELHESVKDDAILAADAVSGREQVVEGASRVAEVPALERVLQSKHGSVGEEIAGKETVVRVIDGVTLLPEADVEVVWFDHATDPKSERRRGGNQYLDAETKLEKFGDSYRTDENGELHMPMQDDSVEVFARVGNRFGHGFSVNRKDKEMLEIEILLMPVQELKVKVRHYDGKPAAGVEIGFANTPLHKAYYPQQSVLTDTDGRAIFKHLEVALHSRRSEPGNTLAVSVPSKDCLYWEFGLNAVPVEVVFQLPPVGEVVVLVEDAEGNPIRDGMPVALQALGDGVSFEKGFLTGKGTRFTQNGQVRFPNVGVEVPLLIYMYSYSAQKSILLKHPGLDALDSSIELKLVVPTAVEPIQFLVVGRENVPLSEGWVQFHQRYRTEKGTVSGTRESRDYDENGLLIMQLGRALADGASQIQIQLVKGMSVAEGQAEFSVFQLELSALGKSDDFGGKENPIRVPMGLDLVVGGRCVDEQGNPVADVELFLTVQERSSIFSRKKGLESQVKVRSDSQGEFRFLGTFDREKFKVELKATRPELLLESQAAIPFDFGQSDLEIQTTVQLSLAGRILVKDLSQIGEIRIHTSRNQVGNEFHQEISTFPSSPTGRFLLSGGTPNGLILLAKDRRSGEVLARWENVPLAAPNAEGVILLPDWDLRDVPMFEHQIEVASWDGAAIPKSRFSFHSGGRAQSLFGNGNVSFLSQERELEVKVGAPGFRSQMVHSTGQASVVLSEGFSVRFTIPEGLELSVGKTWSAILRPTDPESGISMNMQGLLNFSQDQRSHHVVLGEPGAWSLSFLMRPYIENFEEALAWGSNFEVAVSFEDGSRFFEVSLSEEQGVTTIEIPLTQAGIDAAVDGTTKQ